MAEFWARKHHKVRENNAARTRATVVKKFPK
jgi:hypothetical protein